jgi:hypothetical protein
VKVLQWKPLSREAEDWGQPLPSTYLFSHLSWLPFHPCPWPSWIPFLPCHFSFGLPFLFI